uniref:glycerophosphodiester phosphodiesterase n=1 Tax=Aegilops tauschii TaxID=37682 RepID=R7WA67_AEGTA
MEVTKDGCPIVFHDNFIYTEQDGKISGKRVTDLPLDEFLSYGPQKDQDKAFEGVDALVGFNVELKFDDDLDYQEEELAGVYFLTVGGTQIHADARRNSLEEAVRLCRAGGLQGIVSEARAVFRHPSAVARVKESDLSLLTYGQLNNVPEAVYMQHLMGVDGVIVDLVQEIAEAVSEFAAVVAPEPSPEEGQAGRLGPDRAAPAKKTPNFSQREISFLLRLIPELVQ